MAMLPVSPPLYVPPPVSNIWSLMSAQLFKSIPPLFVDFRDTIARGVSGGNQSLVILDQAFALATCACHMAWGIMLLTRKLWIFVLQGVA